MAMEIDNINLVTRVQWLCLNCKAGNFEYVRVTDERFSHKSTETICEECGQEHEIVVVNPSATIAKIEADEE